MAPAQKKVDGSNKDGKIDSGVLHTDLREFLELSADHDDDIPVESFEAKLNPNDSLDQ